MEYSTYVYRCMQWCTLATSHAAGLAIECGLDLGRVAVLLYRRLLVAYARYTSAPLRETVEAAGAFSGGQ